MNDEQWYVVDFDKVESLDDVKIVLDVMIEALQISFQPGFTDYEKMQHLLRPVNHVGYKIEKNPDKTINIVPSSI